MVPITEASVVIAAEAATGVAVTVVTVNMICYREIQIQLLSLRMKQKSFPVLNIFPVVAASSDSIEDRTVNTRRHQRQTEPDIGDDEEKKQSEDTANNNNNVDNNNIENNNTTIPTPIIEAERVPDDELRENYLQMREELNELRALQQRQQQQQHKRQNTSTTTAPAPAMTTTTATTTSTATTTTPSAHPVLATVVSDLSTTTPDTDNHNNHRNNDNHPTRSSTNDIENGTEEMTKGKEIDGRKKVVDNDVDQIH